MSFNDGTEVLLCSDVHAVVYYDKEGRRRSYALAALPNEPTLLRRLKYTKDLLFQLVARPGGGSGAVSSSSVGRKAVTGGGGGGAKTDGQR